MISASNLTLRRGPRVLIEDASFTLHAGWRVGIVGRNGCGKSSLFAALRGELAADKGELSSLKNRSVASVEQDTPARPDAALEFALDGDTELRDLERRLADAEARNDAHAIASLHERLEIIGGYAARARAAAMLHGLGFATDVQDQPVASFSGGWRMRLNLARALLRRSEVLLLDEPTNHLDLDAVLWLQDWLARYRGTLLLVSHDRDFLDAVTTHTLHIEAGRVTLYTGGYSQFERTRAERLQLQADAFAKQQRQIAHLQKFIDRFRASATKATQAQSRIRTLERMERVAAVHVDSPFSFTFAAPARLPSPLLRFEDAAVGYGETAILRRLRLLLAPGDRIGLLGANGAGKSTLVRTLAGELPPLAGTTLRDPYLRVGYFAQHTTDSLDADASPLLHLKRLDPAATEQALRDFLGGFNFHGDRVFEAVAPFSGGEKARLALALVVYQKPNLLLLDEPTNHLDLDMRLALETALLDFPGAVLLVSHDRHLVDALCDRLWWVHDGRCEPFEGDLDDYARALLGGGVPNKGTGKSTAPASKNAPSRTERRRSTAEQRALERPLRDTLKQIESKMTRLQRKLAEIETQMANPALYEDRFAAAKLAQEQGELRKMLNEEEDRWLTAGAELEALAAGTQPDPT